MRGAHDNGSHGSKCLMGLRPGKRRDCGNGAESWEWAWAIAGTTCRSPLPRSLPGSARCIDCFLKILYLIFDYPHKHYTFKYFEV